MLISQKEYQKLYYEKNKEKKSEYRKLHREQLKEYAKEYYKNNKEKALESSRKSRIKNKENVRVSQLKCTYGITLDDWNSLFEKQEGRCAICKRPQDYFEKSLAVDHNHKTGKVRGLLCENCNRAIGLLYDNIDSLRNAIDYLESCDDLDNKA